jgi:hypothetical protein
MRNIAPAIIAVVQILIGFFFLFTLVMVSQYMVSPVLMPDAHVGPTLTLFQCMIPGLVMCGIGGSLGLVFFALGYVAQYIITPRIVAAWRARNPGKDAPARTLDTWEFIKERADLAAQEEPCEVCQTLFLSDEPIDCQYR